MHFQKKKNDSLLKCKVDGKESVKKEWNWHNKIDRKVGRKKDEVLSFVE